ncbi:oxidoreductase/SDR, D-arabitol dehydrogenase [Gluconobacter thailandicus F149-1 = NBRC 100600]|uniref:Polyol dehydrogenase n=1 Tax=Gluconobacter thailandicus NBRC 3257 TaxID=1381097 RepID=A0ABQ0IZX0_GLUTH|nr:SDR family oxidoreductase [Gluconobacter thailandicus]KXV52750.1 3-oxoacyl-ACP reductase [Gluconobacter thailandicus]GAC89199.1 polyol dehydrogenase [Gluconobacter thailandicus NBRC 3255]GAD27755.1 polyol dehydrogenase [Gluconobacter thailandicus NBRC 3257]GAN93221.1 oxidoreductase/SDR, D-arabitol dehydrogenase [Gluconobacter thailandicus F149-1 = NBRC 100600]GBR58444.1 polyol dehydrogenase [Gluconobacter thailandicus F149-1 = NBRC 100600]
MYMEKLRLDGRTAVVTGGAQNIGLACVTALAEAGARVVIADLDEAMAAQSAEELCAEGLDVRSIRMDVTSMENVQAAIKTLHEQEGHLDILVACAGICISEVKAEDMTEGQWLKQVDINLNGMFRCCQAVGRIMLEQKKGAIVAIGSMSGQIVNRPQQQAAYNASKAGVHQYIRSLAAEWAPYGIRANAVAPTYIETTLTRFGMEKPELYDAWIAGTPMGRVGQPDEVASVVHFLASDAASLMTGSIVNVDAGFTVW